MRRRDLIAAGAALTVAGAGRNSAWAQPMPVLSEVKKLTVLDLEDLEKAAEKVMSPGPFAYVAGGGGNEWTLRENRKAFERWVIEPLYLSAVGPPDLSTTILGSKLSLPVITAPLGGQGLVHVSADVGMSQGTGEGGGLMMASTASTKTMEEIAAATKGPKWFQLYLPGDRGIAREFLQRAKAAGYTAVALTVDSYAGPNPLRAQRLGYTPVVAQGNYGGRTSAPKGALNWDDVNFVQEASGLPVILKGVLTPDLAIMAVETGMAGIQISNHGGRQLDTMPATLDVLPGIARAVNKRIPIILDGGVRHGIDVLKALALGATAVAIGRPFDFALGLGGWMGVQSAYDRVRSELTQAMRVVGAPTIAQIRPDCVKRANV